MKVCLTYIAELSSGANKGKVAENDVAGQCWVTGGG